MINKVCRRRVKCLQARLVWMRCIGRREARSARLNTGSIGAGGGPKEDEISVLED